MNVIVIIILVLLLLGPLGYTVYKVAKSNYKPEPKPICDGNNCQNCDKTNCSSSGCNWDGEKCNKSRPICDGNNCQNCDKTNCGSSGCYWDGKSCNKIIKPVCADDNCNLCITADDCNKQDKCIFDTITKSCEDKRNCVFTCTPGGTCDQITGKCDCKIRYAGDDCSIYYPPSLPETVCFVPGKHGTGQILTKHSSPKNGMKSTFVIISEVFDYIQGIYQNPSSYKNGAYSCKENEEKQCLTFCNALTSSSLKWDSSTGTCDSSHTCNIPATEKRILSPPPDPDTTDPSPDLQWSLVDFIQYPPSSGKDSYYYYQIISNQIVNQICDYQTITPAQSTAYKNGVVLATQSLALGISSTSLNKVNYSNTINTNTSIKNAQKIPLITDDFGTPKDTLGDFENGTTWVNLGSCRDNISGKKCMTIYVRIKHPSNNQYIRLYLFADTAPKDDVWKGSCFCMDSDNCDPCVYQGGTLPVPDENNRWASRKTSTLYWIVWNDSDIENAEDATDKQTSILKDVLERFEFTDKVKMPTTLDFLLWNFYGVSPFPRLLPNGKKPFGYDTPDNGGAPTCSIPACPPNISTYYFMDAKGGSPATSGSKTTCHLLEAEPDLFNCLKQKGYYGDCVGAWGYDPNGGSTSSGYCLETGCGNVLSKKCNDDGQSNTDIQYLCDLTRNPEDYYIIDSKKPTKDNDWDGSGVLKYYADLCSNPSTPLKYLYTNSDSGCVPNESETNPDNLFGDPRCLYQCSKYGMVPKVTCQEGQFYCEPSGQEGHAGHCKPITLNQPYDKCYSSMDDCADNC